MSKRVIQEIITRFSGNNYNLVVNREYVKMLGGDATTALMLSQLIYWCDKRSNENDGWVIKSYDEWDKELGLSKYQIKRASKKLVEYGLEVECKRSRYHKGGATNHYKLDFSILSDKVENHIKSELDSEVSLLSDSEVSLQSDSEVSLQSIHRLSETINIDKKLLASCPDAERKISSDDMDQAIYSDSRSTSKNKPDSVKEKEIIKTSKKEKEKSSAKKEKPKKLAPGWGTDAQVLQDAMTAMLMIAWGLNPDDRFDEGKSKALGVYRREAKLLRGAGIHPGNLGDLWRYVKRLAVAGEWSQFTVSALKRYALEFLADGNNTGIAVMTPAERLNIVHKAPEGSIHIDPDVFRQRINALLKPDNERESA